MPRAVRRAVPLKAMCSSMCEMPMRGSVSWRAPQFTQTPRLALSSCGIGSVATVKPLARRVISTFMVCRSGLDEGAQGARVVGKDRIAFGTQIRVLEARRQGGDH